MFFANLHNHSDVMGGFDLYISEKAKNKRRKRFITFPPFLC